MSLAKLIAALPFFVVAVIAISFHEAAHGYVANACGDDTAKRMGRVSLNPLRHISLVGTVLLPLFLYLMHSPILFGWAKPVPVDWSKLRHWRRDMMLVAAAGPGANFLLAGASLAVFLGLHGTGLMTPAVQQVLGASVGLNLFLALFNLIPIPPLDGSKVLAGLLPEKWAMWVAGFRRRAAGAVRWHRSQAALRDGVPSKPPANLGL